MSTDLVEEESPEQLREDRAAAKAWSSVAELILERPQRSALHQAP